MTATYFPVVTICGSMRYYPRMLEKALEFTRDGWIVLMPHDSAYKDGACSDATKVMLDDMHRTKISMSEKIYVVGEHIGESTRGEIQYAEATGVKVEYEAW